MITWFLVVDGRTLLIPPRPFSFAGPVGTFWLRCFPIVALAISEAFAFRPREKLR